MNMNVGRGDQPSAGIRPPYLKSGGQDSAPPDEDSAHGPPTWLLIFEDSRCWPILAWRFESHQLPSTPKDWRLVGLAGITGIAPRPRHHSLRRTMRYVSATSIVASARKITASIPWNSQNRLPGW
jgi:hypothetical protein